MKLLVVEDDMAIASGLVYSLEQEAYEVDHAASFRQAREKISTGSYDLCLFDISLPDGNGYDLCKMVKEKDDTPVIFLTAWDDEVNVVMGLDIGADDYITKPFRIRELLSRIKTVLRRYQKASAIPNVYQISDLQIYMNEAKVFKGDEEVYLTALEYRLLLTFVKNEGQVLSRNQLLEGIWDVSGDFVNDNTLTVYIKRLREKLEDENTQGKLIQTVRGLGYRLGDGHVKK